MGSSTCCSTIWGQCCYASLLLLLLLLLRLLQASKHLLQQIEEYDGVCILATNLIGNIDEAFMRRITYVVHFPFPDRRMREDIYRHMMPPAAPLAEDIDWGFLAEKFELSGGHIKNIVLSAAFMAAGENSPIGMRHLLRAAVGEMKKNEIVVVREELREYADLLEDEGE